MPAVETTCVIEPYTNLTSYGTYIHLGDMLACYQDQTNTMPSFPEYNQTFKSLAFYGKWVMRHLHKSLLSGIPFMERLQLQNIGLQHLSCDVFTNIREELTILNLDDNMLTHFPACSVNTLYRLKELTLSKNFINCIPEHSLPNFLETLDVSYNQISVVNHAVSTDVHNENLLKTFNITGNNLSSINKNELQQFSTLQILDASENKLVYIHPRSFITSGRHLLVIDLSQNQLTSTIWLALENLQRVQNLNLSHNQIDRIDDNKV
ncbi:leucine-rich repeats and immunoglobulin-like domains protein sma-10 [Argopecten irradians]|uniref:leucine-rich repeats and immunoglobulin-like domains protein sma-10 n=1 Tax=Argopecten irradians TaxID=31199 RepID=UPI003711EBCE